ncbi:MAG: DUF721 domain-containing protein [Magnetococcales bacterium]|nr:DUF721 domain-containing protein [Magnetococcales bacterium]
MAKPRKITGLQPISHLIKRVTGKMLDHPNSKAHRLWRDWRRAVGDLIAKHTEPIRLENGVLHVRVGNPAWMSNLTFMKPTILLALQKSYPDGVIVDLRFKGESLRHKVDTTPSKPPPTLPPSLPEERQKAQQLVEQVSDPDLKIMLGKLYESHLVRKRCDPAYRKR